MAVSRNIQFGAKKRDIRDNFHRLKLTVPGPFSPIVHDQCAARLLVGGLCQDARNADIALSACLWMEAEILAVLNCVSQGRWLV
jgi:hypothetical protein